LGVPEPPTAAVATAFGVPGRAEPKLLPGGQGQAWRGGDVVLKPVGLPTETAWLADVFDNWLASDTVRVPRPIRAVNGSWVYEGWAAHEWVAGRSASMRHEPAVIRGACEDFHAVVECLERPTFLDERKDPWSFGDRVAWEGAEPQGNTPTLELIDSGLAALHPVESQPQIVHGDIAGNVLVSAGLPPGVIDWPPYYRPRGWALAVAAVDAICWDGVPLRLLEAWSDVPEWDQLLLRAVIYRVATRGRNEALGVHVGSSEEYVAQRRPSLEAVLARLERRRQ
jgi:uncharacterized protein (TIGR02569 family)